MKGLVESLRTAVSSETGTDEELTTTLYACPDCETTYISEEMESCPRCDGPVERTPSEEELGIET